MAEKAQHIQATEADESVAKSRFSEKLMEGSDYVDRGDYYEVVVKGIYINTAGRVGAQLKGTLGSHYGMEMQWESLTRGMESHLKEDYILLSGVPPITVKYPKIRTALNFEVYKDLEINILNQIAQNIREAPKEVHAAYRQAYYKAIEEYDQRPKNKPPSELRNLEEEIEKFMDEKLSLAQKADKIIMDEQIMADQMRALYRKANTKNDRNQSGQVHPQTVNVDLAAMLSVKGTFKESGIEEQISKRQAELQVMTETIIASARINDRIIEHKKAMLALLRENYEKRCRTDHGEARIFDEAILGFKDNLSP